MPPWGVTGAGLFMKPNCLKQKPATERLSRPIAWDSSRLSLLLCAGLRAVERSSSVGRAQCRPSSTYPYLCYLVPKSAHVENGKLPFIEHPLNACGLELGTLPW